jgi:hypothetical protein
MNYTQDFIAAFRGDVPDACDFCFQAYTEERQPEPEEAGAWACTECVKRWRTHDGEAKA